MSEQLCGLCSQASASFYQHYHNCPHCDLIFLAPSEYLDSYAEKAQYDLHQNSPTDQAYRDFLNQLVEPLSELQKPPAMVLDFGCGPGPTLSVMMQELGYQVTNYDPIYCADELALQSGYDLITMTEVIEHCHQPLIVVNKLCQLLNAGGYLGVMTSLHVGREKFESWHYKNDPTHVCFFSTKTMQWLADTCGLQIELQTKRVVIFKKI